MMANSDDIAAAIAVRRARLDVLRPLSEASLAVLADWYDVELTYTSNAIEGSTLSRSETAIVLEKGITIGGRPLSDHLAAIDHAAALQFVRSLARGTEPITEAIVRRLHALVVARTMREEGGVYSRHQRRVAGSRASFPPPHRIADAMGEFGVWLAAVVPDHAIAFEAHYRLVSIHPFSDGNGRTARLLMNLMLLRAGYPPVVIGPPQRAAYLEALETAQTGGSRTDFDRLLEQQLIASLDDHIAHCEQGQV